LKSAALGVMGVAGLGMATKRWTRFPDVDIARCVKVLNDAGYKGFIPFEYEVGGEPVEGTLKLMNDVVDALV
jgi:hypothetical protein